MPTRSAFAALLLVLVPGLASCGTAAAEPVSIADMAGIEAALAARRGNACLVNFWATWCPPCVAELPELMEVAHEFRPSGARVLGISLDLMTPGKEPEPTLRAVREFLAQRELELESLLCERTEAAKLVERFGLSEGIPVTLAYDADGKLVDQHLGQASRERFTEMMQKALGR